MEHINEDEDSDDDLLAKVNSNEEVKGHNPLNQLIISQDPVDETEIMSGKG